MVPGREFQVGSSKRLWRRDDGPTFRCGRDDARTAEVYPARRTRVKRIPMFRCTVVNRRCGPRPRDTLRDGGLGDAQFAGSRPRPSLPSRGPGPGEALAGARGLVAGRGTDASGHHPYGGAGRDGRRRWPARPRPSAHQRGGWGARHPAAVWGLPVRPRPAASRQRRLPTIGKAYLGGECRAGAGAEVTFQWSLTTVPAAR